MIDDAPKHGWTCFHCGETFLKDWDARAHFGGCNDSKPACQIKASERSLIEALRRAERDAATAWVALHNETSDFAKAHHAQAARHFEQMRLVEETAYEKGLADGRKLPGQAA